MTEPAAEQRPGRSTCGPRASSTSSSLLPDAAEEPQAFCERVGQILRHELAWLRRQDVRGLLAARASH